MKESYGDRLFGITVYIVIALITIAVVYPLIYVLSASFSEPGAVLRGELWLLPVERPSMLIVVYSTIRTFGQAFATHFYTQRLAPP